MMSALLCSSSLMRESEPGVPQQHCSGYIVHLKCTWNIQNLKTVWERKQLPCFLFEPKKTMVQSDSWYLTCTCTSIELGESGMLS